MSEPKHIRFEQTVLSDPPFKPRWRVNTRKDGSHLGVIRWYGQWGLFVFEPFTDCATIFSADCLMEIARFCEAETKKVKLDSVVETVRRGCAT